MGKTEEAYYDEAEDELNHLADLLLAPDPLPQREQQVKVSHLLHFQMRQLFVALTLK